MSFWHALSCCHFALVVLGARSGGKHGDGQRISHVATDSSILPLERRVAFLILACVPRGASTRRSKRKHGVSRRCGTRAVWADHKQSARRGRSAARTNTARRFACFVSPRCAPKPGRGTMLKIGGTLKYACCAACRAPNNAFQRSG